MSIKTRRWPSTAILSSLEDYPCLRCLSDEQLLLLLARSLCLIVSTDSANECTTAEQVSDAACGHCFSDRQLLQMLVAAVMRYASDHGLVGNLAEQIDDVICLNCVDPRTIHRMIVNEVQRGITNGTLFNPR